MLRDHEVKRVSRFLESLYGCTDIDRLPQVILEELSKVVGSDHTTFNYLAPAVPKAVVLSSPVTEDNERRQRVFARHLAEHPVIRHYMTTGDLRVRKLSDFLSPKEYHGLKLYKTLYHDLRYEDQFGFFLFPPGSEMVAIALARNRRSFTERDRELLNLLRPHIAQAYRRAEEFTRLRRAWDPRDWSHECMCVAVVRLDARGRPVDYPARVRAWMELFFRSSSRDPRELPAEVTDWLSAQRRAARRNNGEAPCMQGKLIRRSKGRSLVLRLMPGRRESETLLVLQLETPLSATGPLRDGGLTRREIEVLLQVEKGMSNDEVAAALGVSRLTVRTHLENIFEKLGVHSRTAAVARMRELLRDGENGAG